MCTFERSEKGMEFFMKIVKKIINSIIAFILTLLIIINFSVIILINTVLQEEYVLSKLDKNGFYEKIDTDLKNEFAGYQYQSGFSEEIFKELYSYSMLKSDVNSIVSAIYKGTEVEISTEEIYNNLSSNIDEYLSQNNITVSDDKKQNIEEFKNIIVDSYKNKVDSVSKYVDNVSDILIKIKNADKFITIGLIVALLFLVVFDLLLNITHISEFFNTIGISVLSSGIILMLVKFIINKNININDILIFNQSLSDFIKYVFFDILNKFNIFGIVFVIVGLFSIIFANYKGAIKKADA